MSTNGQPCAAQRASLVDWLICLIVLLVAAATLWWGAAHYTFFDDEAFSFQRYILPADQIVAALRQHVEPDPPLYYLLVHGWINLFGIEPRAIRSLSILCFLLGVLALHGAARTRYGPRAATVVLAVTAAHPLHLQFAMAARWYGLMFLCVACTVWTATHIVRPSPPVRGDTQAIWRWRLGWVGAATAACYTNYFAPCVIGLIWLVHVARDWHSRPRRLAWFGCAALVVLLYLPWLPVFLEQLARFPRLERAASAYAATAARTAVAALSGNLADPGALSIQDAGAWWVWVPMLLCLAGLALLAWRLRRSQWDLMIITFGCVLAGTVTLSMIDKYVMTFSSPLCLLVGGLLGWSSRDTRPIRRMTGMALALAWIGCYIGFLRQQHWTSVRWLDPFAEVVRDIRTDWSDSDTIIATHPSVRYYWGQSQLSAAQPVDAIAKWSRNAAQVRHPTDLLDAIAAGRGPAGIWVIETAATGSDARAMFDLLCVLGADGNSSAAPYRLQQKTAHAPDPLSARKNRLDPHYRHPPHRITVWRFTR